MQVIGVVGHSDTGKTSFVERLVPALRDRGRVATVKSIHHDVEVDEPGKDTYRHRQAGASDVVGVTPTTTFEIRDGGKQTEVDAGGAETDALRDALVELASDGVDYAVVEGFSSALIPAFVTDPDDCPAVGGRVVAAVGDTADGASVEMHADAVDDARPFHTARTLAGTVGDRGTVVAVTTDVLDAARGDAVAEAEAVAGTALADDAETDAPGVVPGERTTDEWASGGGGEPAEAFERLADELSARADVTAAEAYVRPPVSPGESAVVHLAVAAASRAAAFVATEGARERLTELWPAFEDGTAASTLVL
ncbi:MAG: molybdopterin-guanine dinucleotide biosynthesis protein B [Haloferacaceae archaeon]